MRTIARTIVAAAALLALLIPNLAVADDLPRAKPEEVGFSSERLDRITQRIRDDVAKGVLPGAVLLVARHGKVAHFEAIGVLDPETKAAMTKDAIFRIYSMSKPITTVAAMTLFEEAQFSLDEPIAKYMPQFKDMKVGVERTEGAGEPSLELVPAKKPITIQDLMRHSAGMTYGFFGTGLVKKAYLEAGLDNRDRTNAEVADKIAQLPLAYQPGTTWEYSHATDVLGRLIEVISGKSLLGFEKERLLDPLGMSDTEFYVTDKAKQARIAEPFENDRAMGSGLTMKDPRVAARMESGGGGMVGTAMDYARFLQMLLNGGTLDGKRYLGPRTVAYMTSDHMGNVIVPGPLYLPGPGYGFGLGFSVRKEDGVNFWAGSKGDYAWGGAGGTGFWVDPAQDMLVVFMMQSPKQRVHYRGVVRDMVYAAIIK